MKKKNGFTLVELLAILIILGIIALITVPIISKTLKDARINTAIDSSYGYIRAVDKLYYSKSLNDEDVVEDGIYTVSELKTLGVSVDGREPLEGWVELEESEVVAFSIKIGDYVVTKYRDSEIVCEKGEVQPDEVTSKKMEISAKVDSYVKAALAANSSLTSETALLVSEISGVTTNVADSGWIHFNIVNNSVVVVDYSLTYGTITANYSSLTDGNYVSTFGDARNKPTILPGVLKDDGAKYLVDVVEVYYNPTTGQKCSSSESVSTTGTTTGCLHWYLYSVKGNYANMLLDHNITTAGAENGVWCSGEDYAIGLTDTGLGYSTVEGQGSKAISAGITYSDSINLFPYVNGGGNGNRRGPLTALNTLKLLTNTWNTSTPKVPNSNSVNEYITMYINSEGDTQYIINYSDYHARLITFNEHQNIVSVNNNSKGWLASGTNDSNVFGYWTSTAYSVNRDDIAYRIYNTGNSGADGTSKTEFGVRPVITVNVSDVL